MATLLVSNDGDPSDVFAIPDFWNSPKWRLDSAGPHDGAGGGFFDTDLDIAGTRAQAGPGAAATQSKQDEDGFFKAPFSLSPAPPASAATVPEIASTQDGLVAPEDVAEDPWIDLDDDAARPPGLKTWDAFSPRQPLEADGAVRTPQPPPLITEAGPLAYDQLIVPGVGASLAPPGPALADADPNDYAGCLLALALGRASLLFAWDPAKRSFRQTAAHVKLSGYSVEVLQGITRVCLACGNNMRLLRSFVDKTYAARPTPSRVALARTLDMLVNSIQSELGLRGGSFRSLIQLQAAVRPVASVTDYFRVLVAKLSRSRTDEELLSLLFHEAHTAEYAGELLRDLLRQVLKAVSRPWLDFVEEWLGMRPEKGTPLTTDGPGKGFVRVAKHHETGDANFDLDEADFFLDDDQMPSFVPEDIAQPLFETGRNLRFIWSHHPDHPLSRPQETIRSSEPPGLEWQFEWDAIKDAEQQVVRYETALIMSLKTGQTKQGDRGSQRRRGSSHVSQDIEGAPNSPKHTSSAASWGLRLFGAGEEQIQEQILASMAQLSHPFVAGQVAAAAAVEGDLNMIITQRLFASENGDDADRQRRSVDLAPHWSLLPLLSFGPAVLAQARIVNRECMRLLFEAHQLREHLSVQLEFQMLGNGVFCSRLSHALFDPDLDTAERERGVALSGGVMGLRLTGRDNWPPASSELRLALMGVLADSYGQTRIRRLPAGPARLSGGGHGGVGHPGQTTLPGDMSFAVRALTPAEMDRCMDPDSLEALDFLQLSYKPPAPLVPVITPLILAKYDVVFKLLLRVLRMLFVANQLFRGTVLSHLSTAAEGARDPVGASEFDRACDIEHRFRFEAHHFIKCVAEYFFGTGIGMPWRHFEAWLDQVQADTATEAAEAAAAAAAATDDDDENGTRPAERAGYGGTYGLERLRHRHEEVLDEIMLALFLRKRQQPVLGLLEDIFSLVLRHATGSRSATPGGGGDSDGSGTVMDVGTVYREFRRKVEVFLTVCKGLSEKGGYGSKKRGIPPGAARTAPSDENLIDRLVLALDMSGYYTTKKPGV